MMRVVFNVMLLLCFSVSVARAQNVKYVSFRQEKVLFEPSAFYITDVVDDRVDKNLDGIVDNSSGKHDRLMFSNGLAGSMKAFIEKNLAQTKTGQPVVLHIIDFKANVSQDGALFRVDASVTFAFYAAGKKAIEYAGHSRGTINTDAGDFIEKFLRQSLESDAKRFNAWWQQNGGKIATQQTVRVNVIVSKTTDKPNCIAYSEKRLLQITDFMGPVDGNEVELAATMSGIGMSYIGKTEDGQVVLNVTITPYFDKSQSWFKEQGKNPRVLAHEQAHMDITAIKACELANSIRNTVFTQDNYENVLNDLQRPNAQASNEEENKYDNETNHGIIEDKQITWQNAVKEKVRTIGCY